MGDLGFSRRVGRQASHKKWCESCRHWIEKAPLREHRQHCERAVRRTAKLRRAAELVNSLKDAIRASLDRRQKERAA